MIIGLLFGQLVGKPFGMINLGQIETMKKIGLMCIFIVFLVYMLLSPICVGADKRSSSSLSFADDLYPACINIDDSARPWKLDQGLMESSTISGTVVIDTKTLYNQEATLFLHPTEKEPQVTISRTFEVEQGQFYSFSCLARGPSRKSNDPPFFLPSYGFIFIDWLDSNGAKIPVRDKLMSRPGGEDIWHIKQVHAIAPKGTVKARLTIKTGAHKPRMDSGMWFTEIEWTKAMPVPVKLEVIPRILRTADEEFTIRIERRAKYSLGVDSEMHIELIDKRGNLLRKWMTPNMITLPWIIKTKLPQGQKECSIRVRSKPVKKYVGSICWELSEPILISNSDISNKFRDGKFLLEGNKKVVLGCYHAQRQDYAILKDAGINTVIFKSYDSNEALDICKELDSLEMYGIAHLGGGSQTVANIPRVKAVIEAIRDHNSLLAFSLMDEPTRKGIGPREIAWFGCWVQSLAPKIPTTTNFCGPYTFDCFATTTDVFSTSGYPVYLWRDYGHKEADLRQVSQWKNLTQNLVGDGRGCIAAIETFSFDKINKPPPTPKELRNIVYQVFCSGITSIMYYSVRDAGWYLPDEPIFKTVKEINAEILTLEQWFIKNPVMRENRPIEFVTGKPDEIVTQTWKNNSGWLTIIINLSREDLDICALVKMNRELTLLDGTNLQEQLILKPLEVRVIKYNL